MTTIINFYGAPASGKTTAAAESFVYLKKKGFSVVLVQEYASELILEGNLEKIKDQQAIFKEMLHRVQRAYGQVDYIISDSPLLLNVVYQRYRGLSKPNDQDVFNANSQFKNFNVYLPENPDYYQQFGRIDDLTACKEIDVVLRQVLQESHETIIPSNGHDLLDLLENKLNKTRPL